MPLKVSGKNLDIGEALRTHVETAVAEVAARYFNGGYSGHVVLEPEGSGYRCEAALHVDSGAVLHTSGAAHEPRLAVEKALDRLEKRLRRHKSRLKSHDSRGDAMDATSYVLAATGDEDELPVDYSPAIIAEEPTALQTLTVGGAVLAMDFAGTEVLAFRNAGHGGLNVVYRRPDGNIGWIDPTFSPAGDSAAR